MGRVILPALLAAALSGCPGTASDPPDGATDLPSTGESPGFPDGAPDLQPGADLPPGTDLPPTDHGTDGPGPDPCLAITNDGMKLNPGCDPDFQSNGPTAMGQFIDAAGNASWLFVTGTKFWLYDPAAASGQGAFTAGGKDIAAAVMAMAPADCTTLSPGGMPLNPGCDVTFKANGPTSVGVTRTGTTAGTDGWLLTCGKKFWIYEPQTATGGAAAFVAAGTDVAATTLALQPTSCSVTAADGTPLNPGCDVGYQANGPTAWGELSNPTTGAPIWLFVSGTTYWIYDPAAGASGQFTAAGASLAPLLASFAPGCSSLAADGTPLNPSCDTTFQANGPGAVGELRQPGSGLVSWLLTSGKKFWLLDPTSLTFTAAGADLAAELRKLKTL